MDVMTVLYSLMAWAGITTILLLYSLKATPLRLFLQAKILGRYILPKKIKGLPQLKFEIGKPFGEGGIRTRNALYFKEGKGFMMQPGNIPGFLVPGTIAQTVDTDFLMLVNSLEKVMGGKINSYDELKNAVRAYNTKHPGKPVRLPLYRSVELKDLDGLFPENLNIDLQESAIALEKKKASMADKFNMSVAISIMMVLIGVGILAFFLQKALAGQPCPDCNCAYNFARNATEALVQTQVSAG